jgi:hypothetical protein
MALYRTSLRMAHDNSWLDRRKWSNTFFLEAANATAAAAALAVAWEGALKGAARNTVFAYEAYATDLGASTDDYAVVAIPSGQQRGTLAPPADSEIYLPKVCFAVTLAASAGRPSRKFWRPGLYEGDVFQGRQIEGGLLTAVTGAFVAFVALVGANLRDPDGQALSGVSRIRLTTRSFGRTASVDLPDPPAVG